MKGMNAKDEFTAKKRLFEELGLPMERLNPLYEWPKTEKITDFMEAVMGNEVKYVARRLSMGGVIWNQRGPCGRKPEQMAFDLGHWEIHAMLVAKREKAELMASAQWAEDRKSKRL